MGKYLNPQGKIRCLVMYRANQPIFAIRKGRGVFISHSLPHTIYLAQHGLYSNTRHNYEIINRTVKNNSCLKYRDALPDGLYPSPIHQIPLI